MKPFNLMQLLKVLSREQHIVVGTPFGRCFEGEKEDFDVVKLLEENVLLVDASPHGTIYITVGEWNKY